MLNLSGTKIVPVHGRDARVAPLSAIGRLARGSGFSLLVLFL